MKIHSKESCERLARAICMDLKLYNAADVTHVKRGLPISTTLVEAIEEGRELYVSRAAPEFHDLFDDLFIALVGISPQAADNMATSQQRRPSLDRRQNTPHDSGIQRMDADDSHGMQPERKTVPKITLALLALAILVVVAYFFLNTIN